MCRASHQATRTGQSSLSQSCSISTDPYLPRLQLLLPCAGGQSDPRLTSGCQTIRLCPHCTSCKMRSYDHVTVRGSRCTLRFGAAHAAITQWPCTRQMLASNTTSPVDPPQISMPPRPTEINVERPLTQSPPTAGQPNPKRGVDANERALWNWVNVYNLDAFLQEVYPYYYGKDIFYCSQAGVEPCVGVPSAVWLICASTLIKSQLPDIVVDRCIFRCVLFSLNTQRPFLTIFSTVSWALRFVSSCCFVLSTLGKSLRLS